MLQLSKQYRGPLRSLIREAAVLTMRQQLHRPPHSLFSTFLVLLFWFEDKI